MIIQRQPASVNSDIWEHVRFANPRNNPVLSIVNTIHPKNLELFALRPFLRRFAARTWEELPTHNGAVCQTFYEAARQRGLLSNPDQEAVICLQNAIDLQKHPSNMPFRLAQMVNYGPGCRQLDNQFFAKLADEGDALQDVHRKIDHLLHPDRYAYCGPQDDQMPPISDFDSHLSLLTPGQHSVASKSIEAFAYGTHQFMFLQD
jgi:hypothetical protein